MQATKKGPSGRPANKGLTATVLTRSGTPRQRNERQYYGATGDGRVLTFNDYASREVAVANGEVRRIGAHEARFLGSKRSPGPYVSRSDLIKTPSTAEEVSAHHQRGASKDDPTVVRAKLGQVVALLDMAVGNITQIQSILRDIAGK